MSRLCPKCMNGCETVEGEDIWVCEHCKIIYTEGRDDYDRKRV